jgi:hypothetical protein
MVENKPPPSNAPAECELAPCSLPEKKIDGTELLMNATAKAPSGKSSTERNRARRALLKERGIEEVRGVYAPHGLHAAVKAMIRAWLAQNPNG